MENFITIINDWFGYIRNIAVGGGAIFVIMLARTLSGFLKSNRFGEQIVGLGVTKLKQTLAQDSPERKEIIRLIEEQPEIQALIKKGGELVDFQLIELKKLMLDIETKIASGILEREQLLRYQELYNNIIKQVEILEDEK